MNSGLSGVRMDLTCSLHISTEPGVPQRLGNLFRYFLELPEMVALKARLLLMWEIGFFGRQFVSLLSDGMPLEVGRKPAGGQL